MKRLRTMHMQPKGMHRMPENTGSMQAALTAVRLRSGSSINGQQREPRQVCAEAPAERNYGIVDIQVSTSF